MIVVSNENGIVGIIMGVESPDLPKYCSFPGGKVILASVQLLTPEELEYVSEARAEGRNALHSKLKESGIYHFLSPNRKSLITNNDTETVTHEQMASSVPSIKGQAKSWWKFW